MKKSLFLCLFLSLTAFVCAQTAESLQRYFKENILDLDPIEGIYDVQVTMKYVTPYVNQTKDYHMTFYIKETYRGCGNFITYINNDEGFSLAANSNIKRIGETLAYYFSYKTSQSRFVLENQSYFRVVVPLDHETAVYVTDNPKLSSNLVKITYIYEFIKTYPTSSMYLEAAKEEARKAEEEYQKALEEAQKKAGWSGSGFALNQGHIVTNYHVIEDAKTILVKGVKGDFQTELKAKVVATDKVNDIAILQIDDERFKGFGTIPYKIKRGMSDVGESVWALGYPLTDVMGEEVKFTDGKISSRTGLQGDVSVYQISVPIQPGNSGGALFDENGNIVGITSSGLNRETFNSENVNYAIKTSYLYNLIESALSSTIIPQGTAMQGQALTQKIKLAKNFVFIIMCSSSSDFHTGKSSDVYSTDISTNNSSSDNIISNPTVRTAVSKSAKINRVKLTKDYTAIEITYTNYYQSGGWCSIDKNTYISVSGTHYTMTRADGIKISPERTTFSSYGQTLTFTLYFPPIPDTASINLIESENSEWRWYGILLK